MGGIDRHGFLLHIHYFGRRPSARPSDMAGGRLEATELNEASHLG